MLCFVLVVLCQICQAHSSQTSRKVHNWSQSKIGIKGPIGNKFSHLHRDLHTHVNIDIGIYTYLMKMVNCAIAAIRFPGVAQLQFEKNIIQLIPSPYYSTPPKWSQICLNPLCPPWFLGAVWTSGDVICEAGSVSFQPKGVWIFTCDFQLWFSHMIGDETCYTHLDLRKSSHAVAKTVSTTANSTHSSLKEWARFAVSPLGFPSSLLRYLSACIRDVAFVRKVVLLCKRSHPL